MPFNNLVITFWHLHRVWHIIFLRGNFERQLVKIRMNNIEYVHTLLSSPRWIFPLCASVSWLWDLVGPLSSFGTACNFSGPSRATKFPGPSKGTTRRMIFLWKVNEKQLEIRHSLAGSEKLVVGCGVAPTQTSSYF